MVTLFACAAPLDNRPATKPHFAAPPAPKLAPAILQPINTASSSSSRTGSSNTAAGKARASLGPTVHRSRVPRVSSIGTGGAGFQKFALPVGGRRSLIEEAPAGGLGGLGLTEKDIEEKVSVSLHVSHSTVPVVWVLSPHWSWACFHQFRTMLRHPGSVWKVCYGRF